MTQLFTDAQDPVCMGLAQALLSHDQLTQGSFVRVHGKTLLFVKPVELCERLEGLNRTASAIDTGDDVIAWLQTNGQVAPRFFDRRQKPKKQHLRLWTKSRDDVKPRSIFLKAGFSGWADSALKAWLTTRPDLCPVAIVGCPDWLDQPEYVTPELVTQRHLELEAIAHFARVVIVPSEIARTRMTVALGRAQIPIHVQSWPSILAGTKLSTRNPTLAAVPYWVAPLPIEAGQNTWLLLTVWRDMIHKGLSHVGSAVPKLILTGQRGNQIDQIAPLLDWCEALRPHICEAPHLSPSALRLLVDHARGVLLPAFTEPTGALARDLAQLGSRMIAADIPIFREALADKSLFLNPIDGAGWRDAISHQSIEPSVGDEAIQLSDWAHFYTGIAPILAQL